MYFSTVSCLVITIATLSKASVADKKYCSNLDPTTDFDVDAVLGLYFVEEIIYHNRNDTRTEQDWDCFLVHIRKPEDILIDGATHTTPSYYLATTPQYQYGPRVQQQHPENRDRHLVLQWDEPGNAADYHIKLNMSRRGFWRSEAPSNDGRLPDMYNHFAGTIQVIKAVSNHLVLSFCQRLPESKLFTVILSRQPGQLLDVDIIGIHGLLSRNNLSTSAVRKVCANSGKSLIVGVQSIILAILSYLLASA